MLSASLLIPRWMTTNQAHFATVTDSLDLNFVRPIRTLRHVHPSEGTGSACKRDHLQAVRVGRIHRNRCTCRRLIVHRDRVIRRDAGRSTVILDVQMDQRVV